MSKVIIKHVQEENDKDSASDSEGNDDWEQIWDPDTDEPFWFSQRRNSKRWDVPDEVGIYRHIIGFYVRIMWEAEVCNRTRASLFLLTNPPT